MSSEKIKAALMMYWRYEKQRVAIDEFDGMDIAVYGEDKLLEIEIKISKSDLRADKKKDKHRYYNGIKKVFNNRFNLCPSHFYFCVPYDLKDVALEEIQKVNPNYGLITIHKDFNLFNSLNIIKKAKKLRDIEESKEYILWKISMRCSAKICNINEQEYRKSTL